MDKKRNFTAAGIAFTALDSGCSHRVFRAFRRAMNTPLAKA
ncbi:hypothetical protein [Nitrosomonas aestuarii]|nr:hypothetical protein [Nitrosomonas aestuarii]